MGEALHADQGARGQIAREVLEALIAYTVVLLDVGRKRRGFDHVREVGSRRPKGTADILANLTELGAHVSGMDRRSILFASGSHSGNKDQSPPSDRHDLGVTFSNRQISRLDDCFRMGHLRLPCERTKRREKIGQSLAATHFTTEVGYPLRAGSTTQKEAVA